jgi:hypothetical protein
MKWSMTQSTVKDSKRRSSFVSGSGSDYEEVEKLQEKTRGFEDEYLKEMKEQQKQRRALEQLKFINDAVLARRAILCPGSSWANFRQEFTVNLQRCANVP